MSDGNAGIWPVTDLRGFLLGIWRLDRILVDGHLGQGGSMEGTALFAPSGVRLLYSEAGILRFGGHAGNAGQSYVYDFPEPGRASISRHDGSRFVDVDLTRGQSSVVHHCGDDVYHGTFEVSASAEWRVEWRVAGPRKDQRISTRYRRLS